MPHILRGLALAVTTLALPLLTCAVPVSTAAGAPEPGPTGTAVRAADPGAAGTLSGPGTFVDLPISPAASAYTVAPDGSFWIMTFGQLAHVAADGTLLPGGFTVAGAAMPASIGISGSRVYVAEVTSQHIRSYDVGTGSGVVSDALTDARVGVPFGHVRAFGTHLYVALGGKVARLTTSTTPDPVHPFLPQLWMGTAINATNPAPTTWQTCYVAADGSPVGGLTVAECATRPGVGGAPLGFLNGAVDVAWTPSGLLVLESAASRVTVTRGGQSWESVTPVPVAVFASPGSGDGQLSDPRSLVRDDRTGHVFVADAGNHRISEFDADGTFLASYGYGVRTGGTGWETCGPATGACRAGRDYFYDQLDLVGDHLLVHAVTGPPSFLFGRIQVLTVVRPVPPTMTVHLTAGRHRVTRGHRVRLHVRITPAACGDDPVLLQRRTREGWRRVVPPLPLSTSCRLERRSPPVRGRIVLRALLLGESHDVLATSERLVLRVSRDRQGA